MSIHTFAKRLRNLRNRVQIDVNRHLGRTFIPHHAGKLFVETRRLCNLKGQFCACAKKTSPRVNMENDFFADCIDQAVDLGYVRFHLTPCTGDVFMDKGLFEKLELVDAHPRVGACEFFTNFAIPSADDVERLSHLKKLRSVRISVYGHDLASFVAITTGSTSTTIGAARSRRRTSKGSTSRSAPRARRTSGACTLLFTGVQVMATGIVNGCACRDVDATLRIGDLHVSRLADILSFNNSDYVALIREQEGGAFRPVRQGCDLYKSIYRTRRGARRRGRAAHTLSEILSQSNAPRPPAPTRP